MCAGPIMIIRPVARISVLRFYFMRDFFMTMSTLLAMHTRINYAKAAKNCVTSDRNGNTVVAKNNILDFKQSHTVSMEPGVKASLCSE